jgi:hypothetical protein
MGVFACSRPPLHVLQDGPLVIIDMQSLGEYPSDVAGIHLMDASRRDVVWELRGRGGAQLGRVSLTIGENPVLPADIRHGTYEVPTPAGRQTLR